MDKPQAHAQYQPDPEPPAGPRSVAVFGAEQSLGAEIVRLARDAGSRVLACYTTGTSTAFEPEDGLELAEVSLDAPAAFASRLREQDAVILAWAPWAIAPQRRAEIFAITFLKRIQTLLETSAAHGVRRVVLLGDAGWFAPESREAYTLEKNPISSFAYGRGISLIWEGLRSACRGYGLGVRVHPGTVYGAGTWYNRLIHRVKYQDILRVVGDGSNWFTPVHVRDAALGLWLAASHGEPDRDYLLGGESVRHEDFIALTLKYMGLHREIGQQAPWWHRLKHGLMATEARLLTCRIRSDRAAQELGWTPEYPTLAKGIPYSLKSMGALAWA